MIPFTQFLRPNGRKVTNPIDRPAEIEEIAAELILRGVRFEAEVIDTVVQLTANYGSKELIGFLVPNGPEIPGKVDELVKRAQKRLNGEPDPEPERPKPEPKQEEAE
jgi:hypothetical protein